jgi:Lon-like ATP-dependent protease
MSDWVFNTEFSDPLKFADFATSLTSADPIDKQKVLEASSPEERLVIALHLVRKEKALISIQKNISAKVEEKLSKQQRDYVLREQIKTINKELGADKDDREDLVKNFRSKIESFKSNVPPATLKIMEDEVSRLSTIEKQSSEFSVVRTYLEWLTSLPWGQFTHDELNLTSARSVLDSDHYGLEDVKKRILEFIAVGKLRGSVGGNILCFVGPPGVGKTSIGKSIASALKRKFYRFSVGGLHDVAEIKGHRRTYVGAMPGKPVQCLKTTGTLNPLILIDEVC